MLDLNILGIDFGAMLNSLALLYDYDDNLIVSSADRDVFAAALATGTDDSTDLNNDGMYDATDQALFDLYYLGVSFSAT